MAARTPTMELSAPRRYPIGVEVLRDRAGLARIHARVWAPARRAVELVRDGGGGAYLLLPEGNGYHAAFVDGLDPGGRYRFRLDGGEVFPDPASRWQPDGPDGPSEVVDPALYEWGDADWRGVSPKGQVVYEIHVGTFTQSGTFRGAIERLPDLADIGVTIVELMPVADFAGRFGWGYDGVNLFAPSRLYGTPDDLRALVDAAHRLELGMILDVVYNHVGPSGNYLAQFSPRYFAERRTEWGDAINFDGPDAAPVREFVVSNARYWIDEFHLDGLRLDATQQIFDDSPRHIVADVAAAVRRAAGGRGTFVVAENEPQDVRLIAEINEGGCGLDALWNDDFHHAALVAATGRAEAYYSGYRGTAQEFVSSAKYGFLYQGEWYAWQKQRRGTPALTAAPARFVNFLQNHDQIANSATGARLHQQTSPGRYRALTALLLLLPQTPMLFQGQELGASAPFRFFADHAPPLAEQIREGRARFLAQFPALAQPDAARVADPADPRTFVCCKLDWSERQRNGAHVALHRDLLRLRRADPVISAQRPRGVDGAVLRDRAFALRFFGTGGDDRLLVVNLGTRFFADPLAEPLMAPPARRADGARLRWRTIFSTDSPDYGGWGAAPPEPQDGGWWIPGEAAVLLAPLDASTSSR